MDRRIKFRHLDAFSAIARAGSFKRAAEELGLTQPAISKTLKELEQIIGVQLMERSRSGVRLTENGEVFLQFAEQSSAALRHGLRSVRTGGRAQAQLKVGMLPSVASALMPQAVARFSSLSPDSVLELLEGAHEDLTVRLRRGQLDIVVGRLGRPQTMQGLVFRQLYAEEVVVVAAPESAACAVNRFEALERFRVLYPPADAAIRPLVARMLIARGVPLYENRIETASTAFGREMVMNELETVWFTSRGVVAEDLAAGRLTALPLDTRATEGAVGIIHVAKDAPTPAMRAFTGALQFVAQEGRHGGALGIS